MLLSNTHSKFFTVLRRTIMNSKGEDTKKEAQKKEKL